MSSVAVERRTAQRREESRLLAALFHAARDGMLIADEKGRLLDANPSLSALTGFSHAELLGRDGFELIGRGPSGETTLLRKDGTPITIDYHWVPNIQPGRNLGVARDVTEQKLLREDLAQSREYLRKLLDSMAEGILIVDVEARVTWANPAAERLLGPLSNGTVPWKESGSRYRGLLPDGAPVTRDSSLVLKVLREGNPLSAQERTIETADGERRDILVNAAPLRQPNGAIEGVVLSFGEVTSVKRAERDLALRLREQAAVARLGKEALGTQPLASLLDSAVSLVAEALGADVVGIFEVAPGGDELVERARHGLPGTKPGMVRLPNSDRLLPGRAMSSPGPLIVRDYREAEVELPKRLVERGVRSGMAVVIPGRSEAFGTVAAYSIRPGAFVQVDADFLQAIANVLADAIERKQAEDALSERSRQLDQARADLELMLATVQALDQERRELLAGQVAAQDLERRRVARELHDSIGQLLTSASLYAKSVAEEHPAGEINISKLRGLLDEALRQTRSLAWSLRPVELTDLGLASALRRLAQSIQEQSGLKIDLHCSRLKAAVPHEVEAATYRVVQEALANVVRHAQAQCASVVVARRGEQLVTVVEDDGRGLPEGRPSTTGLGLRGMHERAEVLGGSLKVESSPGRGTTLRFEVPLA